jgi:hypothetical protein
MHWEAQVRFTEYAKFMDPKAIENLVQQAWWLTSVVLVDIFLYRWLKKLEKRVWCIVRYSSSMHRNCGKSG